MSHGPRLATLDADNSSSTNTTTYIEASENINTLMSSIDNYAGQIANLGKNIQTLQDEFKINKSQYETL